MEIFLFGISHRTSPVRVREKYTLTKKKITEFLKEISRYNLISELVVLVTCNRFEVYVVTGDLDDTIKIFIEKLQVVSDDLKYFYSLENKSVVEHLFKVSCGLDSQVIGENEILGQVKDAYFLAKELGLTKKVFNKLFQKAIQVGKYARTKTEISSGNISVVSVVMKMIEKIFSTIENKKIVVISTGKIGELLSKYLINKNVRTVFVANKNYERAIELAKKVSGKAIKFDKLSEEIKDADIIISATSSPHFVLKREDISRITKNKLIIFDLAVPRDVEPSIKNLESITLYDLDDINVIIEENYEKKLQEAHKAKLIIEEKTEEFWQCVSSILRLQCSMLTGEYSGLAHGQVI